MESSPRSGERGETLIEILIALVVLSVGVIALMGGLGIAVFGSSLHRNQSDADAALVMGLETVKALPFVPCATWSSVAYSATPPAPSTPPAPPTPGSQYFSSHYASWPTYTPSTVSTPAPATGYFVVTTKAWDGSQFYAVTPKNPCPAMDFVQQVTINAVSPGGRAQQQTAVVKGNWK
jgi:type II secretory pathway pseudopilin PulG